MTGPRVHRHAELAGLLAAAAARVTDVVRTSLTARGRCRLALAGGATPRGLYRLLAASPWRERIDWPALEFFWGDERRVPPEDPASNYRMAREALLDQVPCSPDRIHRLRGEIDPDQAVAEYTAALGEEPLDLVLLGMGADGHTASLFPGAATPVAGERKVIATRSPAPPFERISLTLPVLNSAGAVIFLVAGRDKAARVGEVLGQIAAGRPELPAARVQPVRGSWEWFLDEDAARDLPRT